MQQGFGIILLAEEVMRERRVAEAVANLRAREAQEAREARAASRAGRRTSRRRRRLALRVPRFVLSLSLVPTSGRGARK